MARDRRFLALPYALLVCSLLTSLPAHADAPTPDERIRIEAKPRGLIFKR